jgi:hypothetical protein
LAEGKIRKRGINPLLLRNLLNAVEHAPTSLAS